MPPEILTFTGKWFNVLEPDPALIDIEDIASALSKLCRFGGHCRHFYSVAEHSVLVARLIAERGAAAPSDIAWGLLHDASEAYVVDIPRPIKHQLPDYQAIEERIQQAVAQRFGLPWPMPAAAHQADHDLLALELRAYLPAQPEGRLPPLGQALPRNSLPERPLFPDAARALFLETAGLLGIASPNQVSGAARTFVFSADDDPVLGDDTPATGVAAHKDATRTIQARTNSTS